jgi:succinate dehydrogenase / fumarate reductase membrane anchor subunit
MNQASVLRKSREGAGLWLFKIAAGLLIVVLLGVHFVINHLVAPEGLLTYADVVRYYAIPFVPFMEILFLVVVIAHALVGLRSILLDLNPPVGLIKVIDGLFWLAGIGFTVYGVWLVWVIAQQSAGL